jgi:hypothetical protein
MEETTYNFPLFFKTTKSGFENLNNQANQLLRLPNTGADTYCEPKIDKFNNYYFTVNSEVASLVDLDKCVGFDAIEMEANQND